MKHLLPIDESSQNKSPTQTPRVHIKVAEVWTPYLQNATPHAILKESDLNIGYYSIQEKMSFEGITKFKVL